MSTAKKKIIPIEVRGEYILGSGVSIGARGSYDSVVLRTKFDDSWIGLNKYATWTNALGVDGDQKIITALDLVDGEVDTYDIPVPAFATEEAGTVKVSFTGYVLGDGKKTIDSLANTVSGAFRVLDSNATKLDGGDMDATVAQQLLAAMADLSDEWKILDGEMDDLKGEMDDLEDRMDNFTDKELERQAKEIEREQAENGRDNAETERKTAENTRFSNEVTREANEQARVANEQAREAVFGNLERAIEEILKIQNDLMGGGV